MSASQTVPLGRASPGRLLAASLALGALVRAAMVLRADFPLGDGGLFLVMARAVRDAGYRLPAFVDYNGVRIPFAYPPVGFYVVAALRDLLGLDMVQALRVVPLAATVAALGAFALFARDLMPRVAPEGVDARWAAAAAVLAFALLPRSYAWLLMGGGLTRSLGFLFAVLSVRQAYRLGTGGAWRDAVVLGVYGGLTAASHLGTAPFAAFSVALVGVACSRHRRTVPGLVLAGVVAAAVTAPWWGTVAARHGLAPFLAAQATGGNAFSGPAERDAVVARLQQLGLFDTGEAFFPLVAVLGTLGAVVSLRWGLWLLPVWWVLILVLDVRAPGTYASIPVALLAGVAVQAVLVPLLAGRAGGAPTAPEAGRWAPARRAVVRWAPGAIAAGLVAYAAFGAVARRGADLDLLRALPPDERAAMAWARASLPPDARVAVVTGAGHRGVWGDRVSEWFPVLAERVSVATIQGREWLRDGTFRRREQAYNALQRCADSDAAVGCLDAWARASATPYTHVFVTREPALAGCCDRIAAALRAAPGFAVLYDGPGGLVAARRAGSPEGTGPSASGPAGGN